MGPEHPDGLPRLHEEGLVVAETAEGLHDPVEALPGAGGLSTAAVHDELVGALRDLGIEIVHEHAKRRLGEPAPARAGRSARRPYHSLRHWGITSGKLYLS